MSENKTDKTAFWTFLGKGLAIFLICLGMGTCNMLAQSSFQIEKRTKENEPTIQIDGK